MLSLRLCDRCLLVSWRECVDRRKWNESKRSMDITRQTQDTEQQQASEKQNDVEGDETNWR